MCWSSELAVRGAKAHARTCGCDACACVRACVHINGTPIISTYYVCMYVCMYYRLLPKLPIYNYFFLPCNGDGDGGRWFPQMRTAHSRTHMCAIHAHTHTRSIRSRRRRRRRRHPFIKPRSKHAACARRRVRVQLMAIHRRRRLRRLLASVMRSYTSVFHRSPQPVVVVVAVMCCRQLLRTQMLRVARCVLRAL